MLGLARHYLSTLCANLAILLLGTISGVLAARLLGPVGRGELAIITLWPMALAMLGALGMNQAITFFAAREPARRNALFTALLSVAAAQSLFLLAVGYFLLPRLLAPHRPLILHLAQLFLLYIPLAFFSGYLLNLLQGGLHLGAFNFSRMFLAAWYTLLLAVVFLLERPNLALIIAGQLAGYAAATGLNAYWVRRRFHPRLAWDPALFKPLLSYGAKTQLGAMTTYLNLRLDQLVMSVWLAPEALGLYVVAVTLASPLAVLPSAISMVTLPAAARESPAAARAVIRHSFRTVVLLLAAGAALLFLLVPYLLPFFFGQAFTPATAACRILVVAMVPWGLAHVLYDSLRALNHPLVPAYAELVGNGVTIVLLYLLLPGFGFLGAAFASLGAYTASFLFLLWYVHSRAGFSLGELLRAGAADSGLPSDAALAPPAQDSQA
ncbi:MAG: oligosaccharide flippase family protein [Terriglobia bacterium]